MSYRKFLLMMAISFFVMYFLMFLNMDSIEHYHTSLTRIYMAVLMTASMAVTMMIIMRNMYLNKTKNITIIIGAFIIFISAFFGLRTQALVSDRQYMKAMISHHSSAIMTSKHANIRDPELRRLADSIIVSQEREIGEMEMLLKKIK